MCATLGVSHRSYPRLGEGFSMITNEYKTNFQHRTVICRVYGKRAKGNYTFWFDAEDENLVRRHKWNMTPKRYVYCTCHQILLHRLLTNAPAGRVVDHIDHHPENNRKVNLRVVSHAENMWNRGANANNPLPVKGIRWNGASWGAEIQKNAQVFKKYGFDTMHEAICWKIRREYELYGDKSPNYRPVLKHMPKKLLKIYFPEIYGQHNHKFIGSFIFNAHYKNRQHKNWDKHMAAARKDVGTPM